MNFGNKNKRVVLPEEIMYDRQKNSDFNEGKYQAKTKKKRKVVLPKSVDSETLWREVNLFWPETIAIVGAGVAGIILMFVVRFMSATGLELIREMLSDQAYVEVAGLIQNTNTIFMGVAAIPFLVLIGFYAYRLFVFTPRKNKFLVARVKSTGAIRLSVDSIKDHQMDFERGMSNKMMINNPRKHWLENVGKPIIFLFEGDDANADLNLMAGDINNKSKEINTVNDNAISYGRRIEKYIQENKGNLLTPTNILLIVILGAIGLTLFLVLRNPEVTAGLMGAV